MSNTVHRFQARESTSVKTISCRHCAHSTLTLKSALEHFRSEHASNAESAGVCHLCGENYQSLALHARSHFEIRFNCVSCAKFFPTKERAFTHFRLQHSVPPGDYFTEIESAFKKSIQTFARKFPAERYQTFDQLYHNATPRVMKLIRHQLRIKPGLRYSVIVFAKYIKRDQDNKVQEESLFALRTARSDPVYRATKPRSLRRDLQRCFHQLEVRNDSVLTCGSGWTLDYFSGLNVEVGAVPNATDFVGNASDSHPFLKKLNQFGYRKYVTDIPTEYDDCFFTAVAAGLLPEPPLAPTLSEADQLIARAYMRTHLRWKDMQNGMALSDIRSFEKKNRALNVGINVFGLDVKNKLYPLYQPVTLKSKNLRIVNLLFLENVVNKRQKKNHFMLINNLRGFYGKNKFPCDLCLNTFGRQNLLDQHYELCRHNSPQQTVIPAKGDNITFKNFSNRLLQPVYGTLDFEACMHAQPGDNSVGVKTKRISEQVPCTYSLYVQDKDGKVLFHETRSSDTDLLKILFRSLDRIESKIYPKLNKYKRFLPTAAEEHSFQAADKCYLCEGSFPDSDATVDASNRKEFFQKRKCRDHCHYTGRYLGAAHNKCNLKRTWSQTIPIFVHNLQNYDSHFLLQGIKHSNKQIKGIPINTEKFKTLRIGQISFIDSCSLLPCSLAELVNNLAKSNYTFPALSRMVGSEQEKQLLLRKGVFPYEWAQSVAQMEATTFLPQRESFFSSLTQQGISERDYEHAEQVFSFFKCKNMLDYCELYCQLDTVLLFEVMESFRSTIKENFGLDCTRYISAPQLAFDCMLSTLDEPIELMSDPDMILMCENNIRGGVSFVGERWVAADPEGNRNLVYIDANNLYGFAQQSPLPVGNYQWCTRDEVDRLGKEIHSKGLDDEIGYILEVDLFYPPLVHDKHASMPLAAEKIGFTAKDLSPYSKKSVKILRGKAALKHYKSEKLCTTLKNKRKYVCHYRSLQTFLRNGLKLDKIHKAFSFRQKRYMMPYIQKCTALRARSKSAFLKLLYKLMCNSCYGRLLMSERNFTKAFICKKESIFSKHYNSPAYVTHKILDEEVAIVYEKLVKIKMNRPFVSGFVVLEFAKDHMNRAYYEFIQPRLGINNVSVVLTDTDSLVLHVKNMSRDEMWDKLQPVMDFSNYPVDHPRYNSRFKAIPGYFKDEHASNELKEIVALRSKCYVMSSTDQESIVCKGVTKAGKQSLDIETYRSCVRDFNQVETTMHNISSKNHVMYTQETRRIALSSTDDKRYLLPCGIHTLPIGHFRIRSNPACLECNQSQL